MVTLTSKRTTRPPRDLAHDLGDEGALVAAVEPLG